METETNKLPKRTVVTGVWIMNSADWEISAICSGMPVMCVMTKIQCKFLHKTRLPDIVPYNEHDKSECK